MPDEPANIPSRQLERVGKYVILGHIASGGMGEVYKARDVSLDRTVALKVLREDLADKQKVLLRFSREAKAAAHLRHENIVAIFDVGEAGGTHFLALEFVEGIDLQEYITRKSRVDVPEAHRILVQATRALVHAHEKGIVHRDIKPSNFLLTFQGANVTVKLTDFGLAIRGEDDEQQFRITRDGTTVGTVDYMSPEQARNSQGVDIRSDIYSLGCTFFHMLAGTAPFARGSLAERLILHMQKPAPDVRRLNKAVPEALATIIARMLAKKADDRYQTPAALLEVLEKADIVPVPSGPTQVTGGASMAAAPEAVPDEMIALVPLEEPAKEHKPAVPPQHKAPRPGRESEVSGAEKSVANSKSTPREVKKPQTPGDGIDTEEIHPQKVRPLSKPPLKRARKKSSHDTDPVQERAERPGKRAHSTGDASRFEDHKHLPESKPWWLFASAGSLGVLALVLVLAAAFGGRSRVAQDEPVKKVSLPLPVALDSRQDVQPVVDIAPANMGPGSLPLRVMDSSVGNPDRTALRKEYGGPFDSFPQPSGKILSLQVSRLGTVSPSSCRTIAEALARSEPNGWTIIEIQDNGPIFIRSGPALSQRSIILRAAEGYRPVLAWESPKSSTKDPSPPTLLALSGSKLILENLDVVVKWPDEKPATLFDMQDSDFYARGCTFSVTGRSTQGITLVKHRKSKREADDQRMARTWVQRCYVRGPDVNLLSALDASVCLMVDESLVVGQNQPLIHLRPGDDNRFELHAIRSTIVAAQNILRCQTLSELKKNPRIAGFSLDSVLARNDPAAPLGAMVVLVKGTASTRMTWKAKNTIYAGWKQLLSCDEKDIAGDDIQSWHRQWHYSQGDRALLEPWPNQPLSRLEEASRDLFLPQLDAPVAYAALTGSGMAGSVTGRLPEAPASWLPRTFDLPVVPLMDADNSSPPQIDSAQDGLYHGEKIDLNKVEDLGVYLNATLQKLKPAPRIVLHLSGTGNRLSSNIKLKNVQNLVIYFEPDKDAKDTLRLGANPTSSGQRVPLIDIEGGNLELIGVRIQLSPITLMSMVVRVQDGDLTMSRCWLQGPLSKSPDGFKTAISVGGSAASPATLTMRDCVVLSGKLLVHLQDHVHWKARNNVFLSLGDGVLCECVSPTTPTLHVLDHNTFAVRQTIFTLRSGPGGSAQSLMYANCNAFLRPFADEKDKSMLLRGAEAPVARGQWTWQGRFNVYDSRLTSYFGSLDKTAGSKQTLQDWKSAWGSLAEYESLALDAGTALKTINVDAGPAALLSQMDRLVLPRLLRGDPAQAPPGANASLLKVLGKKG